MAIEGRHRGSFVSGGSYGSMISSSPGDWRDLDIWIKRPTYLALRLWIVWMHLIILIAEVVRNYKQRIDLSDAPPNPCSAGSYGVERVRAVVGPVWIAHC